jgi:hypothetical protein
MVLVAAKEMFLNMWVISLQQTECPVCFGNGQIVRMLPISLASLHYARASEREGGTIAVGTTSGLEKIYALQLLEGSQYLDGR